MRSMKPYTLNETLNCRAIGHLRDNWTDAFDTEHLKFDDVMPRLSARSADDAIVKAARTSTGQGIKSDKADRNLIRYLYRQRHTTPFEMVELKFWVSAPIFVARQWMRHRMASINEYSGRYSVMQDRFWKPEAVRCQSEINKQGSDGDMDGESFLAWLDKQADYAGYEQHIQSGVSRELARVGLPLSTYTQWVWKIDLHNLLNFIRLRMDSHAQQEIREYAEQLFRIVEHVAPWTAEAFRDYSLDAVTFTGPELRALTQNDWSMLSEREQKELQEKRKKWLA